MLNRLYPPNINTENSAISLVLVVVLSVIMTFLPFVGFCLSLMFFRQKFAPWLFILFSFYLGWFYEPQMDLLVHYEHFKHIIGKSLIEQWTDSGTLRVGKELYPVFFKYFIGLITDSQNFFSACACTVYTSLFMFGVIKPLHLLYMQKMSIPAWLLFLGVIFTVEYYWFLGFRFWSGVFVFTGFYFRYLSSGNRKYLWLTALSLCFHYSLLVLCVIAILNHFLRSKLVIYYLILIVSFIVRFSSFSIMRFVGQFRMLDGYVKDNITNENIQKSVEQYATNMRNHGNQFYLLREEFAIFGALIVIYILYKNVGKEFIMQNNKLWGFCILLLSIANFGYSSITFYDRFFKIVLLFLYVFVYIWVMSIQHKLDVNLQLKISMVIILPILYLIITPLVEQRHTLFQLKLWFNSLLL